jgi:Apea-like HEPN
MKHPPGMSDTSTVGPRLSRSLRIISRACGQSNADIQFLLCLVALETLASTKKEEIAGAVADMGARIIAVDVTERASFYRALKQAYDARSRLVHEGELPSLGMEPKVVEEFQGLVLRVWAEISRRFFGLVDRGVSEEQLAAGFEEFRGIALLKYGTPWDEAFGLAGTDEGGVE